MLDIHRRSFLRGLAGAFGAATFGDLHARILDNGAPILLKPSVISRQIFVADNGGLALGDICDPRKATPILWLQYFVDCGARTRKEIGEYADLYEVEDVNDPVDADQWPRIFDCRYRPIEASYFYLKQNNIGTRLQNKYKTAGRLDFFAGSNHPASTDMWVEAFDDLSVSLLQARLNEIGSGIELVMEFSGSITKDDPEAYGELPADE